MKSQCMSGAEPNLITEGGVQCLMYANGSSGSKSWRMCLIGWLVSRVLYMLIVGLIVSHGGLA